MMRSKELRQLIREQKQEIDRGQTQSNQWTAKGFRIKQERIAREREHHRDMNSRHDASQP
ncbi:hypothetical protein SAMN05444166_4221 [Singulisphaera sp. GP187]|nr:hypothetical protein SAMN05444166_4221 [Singulisphaera sp. GP187]